MILLLLFGCERDPSLLGYWDIAAMRGGTSADDLEEVTLAGFMEFQSNGDCYAMFSYVWSNGWSADPTPDLVYLTTDAGARTDFIETYRSRGETYTVTMSQTDVRTRSVYTLDEWKGSTVTLASEDAQPPGGEPTTRVVFELDLER